MAKLNASPLGLTLDTLSTAKSGVVGYGDGVDIPSRFNHPNNNTIVFTPWPDGPMNDAGTPSKRRKIHSDEIYDVRLKNIIDITDGLYTVDDHGNAMFPTKLKAMDFAYLKNVGVFPNNRLQIARRYGSPVVDDPTAIKQNPISTMISWVADGEDFLKFEFGEGWEEAEADFTEIFNSAGKDMMGGLGKELGGYLGAGGGAIPLPGFSEGLQRKMMIALGIAGEGSDEYIPSGEPNIIKQAKIRKLVGYGKADSSLNAKVSIKMVCEWEQKFLAGIDPSIAWMDILNTALKFGTSPAKFYLGKGGGANNQKVRDFINGMANKPLETLQGILTSLASEIGDIIDTIVKALNGEEKKDDKTNKDSKLDDATLKEKLSSAVSNVLSTMAKKYKIRLMGVINALTGAASTPWHITIGNPMRPIFCSGDMLVDRVEVTLGPELAFNDLPSTIKAEFTLTNARPLGMDELLAKFNVGYMRTVTIAKDVYTSQNDTDFIPPTDTKAQKSGTQSPSSTPSPGSSQPSSVSNNTMPEQIPGSGVSGTGNSGTEGGNRVGSEPDTINPNANSSTIFEQPASNAIPQTMSDDEISSASTDDLNARQNQITKDQNNLVKINQGTSDPIEQGRIQTQMNQLSTESTKINAQLKTK